MGLSASRLRSTRSERSPGRILDRFGQKLSEANLTDAHLVSANLKSIDLTSANLTGPELSRTFLWEGNLTRANLMESPVLCDLPSAGNHDCVEDGHSSDADQGDEHTGIIAQSLSKV
jgi:hypothetical protein